MCGTGFQLRQQRQERIAGDFHMMNLSLMALDTLALCLSIPLLRLLYEIIGGTPEKVN